MTRVSRSSLAAVVALLLLSGIGHAAAPRFRYGETWWQEYQNDKDTSLLLHFGKAQPIRRKVLARKIQNKKEEDELDLDALNEEQGTPSMLPGADFRQKPVDDSNVPPEIVLDYSDTRGKHELPAGYAKVPGGRFGQALKCTGTGRFACAGFKYDKGQSMECWFKISAYPKQAACLLSIMRDEGRVLLHPDGRVELKLKQPHGHVSRRAVHNTPEQVEKILARDAAIISPTPVPLNEWVHVVAFTHWPVVQGAGSPFDATLKINGEDVAHYLSEVNNGYNFMGRGDSVLVIGNNFEGKQGFAGLIDEVRVSDAVRAFYTRPPMPWRDRSAKRPIHFDKPYFLQDGTVFHASLDKGLDLDLSKADAKNIEYRLRDQGTAGIEIQGVRGKGWVLDPVIGFPRFPLKGMSAMQGTLEFWLRPVNWDDITGYWNTNPIRHRDLSVARFYGRDKRDGQTKLFLEVRLPRAHDNEGKRVPIDPGHWNHYTVVWTKTYLKRGHVLCNGRGISGAPRAKPEDLPHIEPLYVEMGISDKTTVANMERPLIEIDEVVGYNYALTGDEVKQALARWQGTIQPIKLYEPRIQYKFSIAKLEFDLKPKLPPDVTPASLRLGLLDLQSSGKRLYGPFETKLDKGRFHVLLTEGKPIPYGTYRFQFDILDAADHVVLKAHEDWEFKKEPWRDCQAGILKEVPAPWTPIQVQGATVKTRMITYELAENGLPKSITARGKNLLVRPVALLEGGKPMACRGYRMGTNKEVSATWQATFTGASCDVDMLCRMEYDGMIRYELRLKPKGKVAPLTFDIPLSKDRATRYFYNKAGITGVKTGVIDQDKVILESRLPDAGYKEWRAYKQAAKKNPKLTWRAYWHEKIKDLKAYGFFTQIGLNDMDRGLYWFASNAQGWTQSKNVNAQEVVRAGDSVTLRCHLVAEATDYRPTKPIVFGILPHPARPMSNKYRLYQRVSPKRDPLACDIYGSVFRPFPMNPREKMMALYPARDPKNPEAGPSWAYAESCVPSMKDVQTVGYRTLYLSKYWFSCRAGAYDGWEWRGGPTGQCTLSKSFVDYLCWEMDEWIGRGIFNAIYLDECYEAPSRNVEAGQAVLLPDGTIQPGQTLWGFRELMKRWRNIFHQHGMTPMIAGHHTRAWMYCGMVFCDSYLDGEGHPTITATTRDFVDSLALHRAEVIQNGTQWGLSPMFMVSIWEGGLGRGKGWNPHTVWSWRMARGAMSVLAHFENGTAYTDQGAQVYQDYWNDVLRWGAGDASVPFHPYWRNDQYLQVDGQGKDTLVSFYQKGKKLLLIASNRTNRPQEIKVTLHTKALGLSGALKVVSWDKGYARPEGEDIKKEDARKMVQKLKREGTAKDLMELDGEGVGDDDAEDELLGDDAVAERKAEEVRPRLDGKVLILPTRPKDFRMVSIE